MSLQVISSLDICFPQREGILVHGVSLLWWQQKLCNCANPSLSAWLDLQQGDAKRRGNKQTKDMQEGNTSIQEIKGQTQSRQLSNTSTMKTLMHVKEYYGKNTFKQVCSRRGNQNEALVVCSAQMLPDCTRFQMKAWAFQSSHPSVSLIRNGGRCGVFF